MAEGADYFLIWTGIVKITRISLRRFALGLGMVAALGVLSACKSSEEKAEDHFKSGMELLEAGDPDRALVEFRNVFKLNGEHREARQTYARIQRERGNLREAYGQYLRLVEQYPDDLDGNLALAEITLRNGAWDETATYARRAAATAPDNALAMTLVMAVDYRTALEARDEAAIAEILTRAQDRLKADPKQPLLRQLLADDKIRTADLEDALALIDEGIALNPEVDDFYTMRLPVLHELGRTAEITAHLQAMIARKPDDSQARNTLISWYISQNDLDSAETALRAEVDPALDDLEPRVRLVQFLITARSPDVARAELDAILAANPDSVNVALYRSMQANFDFEAGKTEEAMATLQQILTEHPDSPQINGIRLTLANMMSRTGNDVGARAMVEQVLEADRTDVAALKLKAGWLIEDDQTGDALVTLRTALEQNPRDAEAMTLMARAHERDGSTDLMGEMLALAVEASEQAPEESIRYSALLQSQGKTLPAEDVLLNALRRQPENPQILAVLAALYLEMKDLGRAQDVIRTLEGSEAEIGRRLAQELKARLLAASGQADELTQYLSGLAGQDGGTGAEMALVRDAVRRGETDQALVQVAALDAKSPDVPQVGLLHALVLNAAGKAPEAIARLQALTTATPAFEQGWLALYNMQTATGTTQEAAVTLEAALVAMPDNRTLQWALAGELERKGDVDGAIVVYEALYEKDSNWAVVANNLASLLANSRTDEASLERAYVIARRLRGSTEPAFQDTYGWVAFRRGNLDDALTHLEPAAAGLPADMSVQYHLAMVYGALDRRDEALTLLRRVAETSPAPAPALLASVTAEIARIEALPPQGNN